MNTSRLKPGSIASEARRLTAELGFAVTSDKVRWWRTKGYPIHDTEELRQRLLSQERVPKGLRRETSLTAPPDQPLPGADDLSPEALDARLRELQAKLLGTTDYEAARTIRTQIAALRDIFRIQTDRGIYVLASDMRAAGMVAGNASRSAWEKIAADLPPLLEGLTAMQMQVKLRDYARARCVEMASLFAP